jgi:cobaltochelatase CobS
MKTCQKCGQTNLWWKNDGGSWRLADDAGNLHSCRQYRKEGGGQGYAQQGQAEKAEDKTELQKLIDAQQAEAESGGDYKTEAQGQGQGYAQQDGMIVWNIDEDDRRRQLLDAHQRGQQQGEQSESESESQSGGGSGEGGNVQVVTDNGLMPLDKLAKSLKPLLGNGADQKWENAQQLQQIKDKLNAQAARNEKTLTEAVNKHVQAKLEEIQGPPPVIEVKLPDGSKIELGEKVPNSHPLQTELIMLCGMRKNVLLVGPAGTGKTTAAENAAKALGLKFYPFSVGAQTSKTDISGYQDAHSRLVRSIFREAYEHGGIFLLDEVDAGNANVLTLLNSALSNGYFSFPDAVLAKHADFVCVAAGNTYGNGADRQYVGRNQLDAATLDRFITLDWDYDLKLEARIGKSQPDWLGYIHKLRKAREKTGVRTVFSTRAIINGTDLLNAGWKRERVEQVVLWNRISRDDREKITAAL